MSIRSCIATMLGISILGTVLFAQASVGNAPQFSQYKAGQAFSGIPVVPQMNTKNAKRFRTRIREGAAKGPNFDGHYTVVEWGCGGACAQFSIVDAQTGAVYDPPFVIAFGSVSQGFVDGEDSGIHYKLDSSLLVVGGCPNEEDCAIYYYVWDGSALKLVQKRAAKFFPASIPPH